MVCVYDFTYEKYDACKCAIGPGLIGMEEVGEESCPI